MSNGGNNNNNSSSGAHNTYSGHSHFYDEDDDTGLPQLPQQALHHNHNPAGLSSSANSATAAQPNTHNVPNSRLGHYAAPPVPAADTNTTEADFSYHNEPQELFQPSQSTGYSYDPSFSSTTGHSQQHFQQAQGSSQAQSQKPGRIAPQYTQQSSNYDLPVISQITGQTTGGGGIYGSAAIPTAPPAVTNTTQSYHQSLDPDIQQASQYADNIALQNIPPAGSTSGGGTAAAVTSPQGPRPLPQEPVFNQSTTQSQNQNLGFDNLDAVPTSYSHASSISDPFRPQNPFQQQDPFDNDSALNHALQVNDGSNLNNNNASSSTSRLNLPSGATGGALGGATSSGYSHNSPYDNINTSYETPYDSFNNGSNNNNGQSTSNLADLFSDNIPIVGDSYNVNPLSSSVALYDNKMNPIRLGVPSNKTGDSISNLFSQGVFLSQNMGQGIDQNMQNQIQGQFEQNQNQNQASSGGLYDPHFANEQYPGQANDQPGQQRPNFNGNGNGNGDEDDDDGINEDALFLGNLALDCPIPNKLAAKYKIAQDPSRQAAEFVRMKYTAVTSEPERFLFDKFTLRQQLFKIPRTPCEMMIVVTMYNEDDILLGRTLKGIFDNLKYLCTKADKEYWGPDGWKKVVVAIVSDGRTKINPRARALLANLGVYQEGFAQSKVLKKDVTCHLYEHTTLANITSVTDKVNLEYDNVIPVQLIFALKEKNQKKINSHRWCFQALAPALQPDVIVLFDAGTEPTKKSIYKLWREFHLHPNVGGACGEIKAMLGPRGKYLYNGFFSGMLVAGQNFEYKMSNILDKPTESIFGFISVLPGAFSAYRFEALKNDEITGHGPLEAYFKGETLHLSEEKHDLFANNMYLAEDRILCFEIVTKKNSNWVLRYINTAAAATDVPDQLPEFISQRRRWLNGSFFAAIYSIVHFGKIYRSAHSLPRKIFLQLEFLYNTVNIIISWFSVGSFFLVFRILTLALSAKSDIMYFKPGKVIAIILLWLYIACTMSVFIFAFGNKPKGTKKAYWVVTLIYAVMMGYMIFCAIWLSIKSIKTVISDSNGNVSFLTFAKNSNFRDLVISMGSTYVLYIVSSIMYGQPWHMLTSFIQYLLLSPAYINILNIYAFCNIHDISWGTKGDDGSSSGLSSVKKAEDGKGLVLDIPTTAEEVDGLFEKESQLINVIPGTEADEPEPTDPEEIARRAKQRKKQLAEEKGDYYQFARSMVVLVWCITNGVLIALVMNIGGAPSSKTVSDDDPSGGTNATTYLTVILWIVAVLAAVRFIGSMSYLFSRILNTRRQK